MSKRTLNLGVFLAGFLLKLEKQPFTVTCDSERVVKQSERYLRSDRYCSSGI